MKKIIVDGYNLINCRSFPGDANRDLEAQRDHLVRLLHSYGAASDQQILLVFDNAVMQHSHRQQGVVRIIFSRPGQEADDVIRRMVREEKHPDSLTVVTSDRAIRFSARDHGITSLGSDEFCTIMRSLPGRFSESPKDGMAEKYEGNISDTEVNYWLDMFSDDPDDPDASS